MTNADVLSVPHIGPKPHPIRNLFLVGSAVIIGLMAAVFMSRTADLDNPAVAELDQFREAMQNKCKDPRFAGPTSASLAKDYMANEALRRAVVQQFHELQRGRVTCEDVRSTLGAAGYPL
jgi:hypothetical protein